MLYTQSNGGSLRPADDLILSVGRDFMKQTRIPLILGLVGGALISQAAFAQKPDAAVVINRMVSAYRSMLSYKDSGTLTQKVGDKTQTAEVKLAAQRPNKFALDIKGDKFNTQVLSDGTSLIAIRPDRKAYTKTKAPNLLMRADVLAKIDVPAPASRVVAYLLQATLRTSDDAFAKSILESKATGPQPFGGKMAYVLTARYDEDYDAKIYVTDDDFLVRKVTLVKQGDIEFSQTVSNIEVDKPIDAAVFTAKLPDNALFVYTLPPLEKAVVVASGPPAPDFKVQTYQGDTIRLSDLKGKVVLLNFFFND